MAPSTNESVMTKLAPADDAVVAIAPPRRLISPPSEPSSHSGFRGRRAISRVPLPMSTLPQRLGPSNTNSARRAPVRRTRIPSRARSGCSRRSCGRRGWVDHPMLCVHHSSTHTDPKPWNFHPRCWGSHPALWQHQLTANFVNRVSPVDTPQCARTSALASRASPKVPANRRPQPPTWKPLPTRPRSLPITHLGIMTSTW